MKVVFLDIDGVMNSHRSMTEEIAWKQAGNPQRGKTSGHWFAPYHVAPLNRILDQSAAQIVISSTWREIWSLPEIIRVLESQGVRVGRVIDKTPSGTFLPEGSSVTLYGSTPPGWRSIPKSRALSFWTTTPTWTCCCRGWWIPTAQWA